MPSLHSYIGWLQNSIVKISQNTKFWQNYFELHEIQGKFRETRKLKVYQKFCKITKTKFRSDPMQDWSEGGEGGQYSPGASSALMQISAEDAVNYNSVVWDKEYTA